MRKGGLEERVIAKKRTEKANADRKSACVKFTIGDRVCISGRLEGEVVGRTDNDMLRIKLTDGQIGEFPPYNIEIDDTSA